MGQGTDNIPIRIAAEQGILVCNSGGINQVAVAALVTECTIEVEREENADEKKN